MLGKFISVREPNIKYLGLENMVRLAEVPAVSEAINRRAPAHWHPCSPASILARGSIWAPGRHSWQS